MGVFCHWHGGVAEGVPHNTNMGVSNVPSDHVIIMNQSNFTSNQHHPPGDEVERKEANAVTQDVLFAGGDVSVFLDSRDSIHNNSPESATLDKLNQT